MIFLCLEVTDAKTKVVTRKKCDAVPSASSPWAEFFIPYLQQKCETLNRGKPADFPRYFVGDAELKEI
jgi:hypothetical protein